MLAYDINEKDVNYNERYNVRGKSTIGKENSSKNVIIYGFLEKRSKYIHLWKTRFFILTNNYLFAFTGIEDDADCTMALDLRNIIECVEINNEEKAKKEFEVRTIGTNYFFRAEKESIMKRWKDEINKVMKIKNMQSFKDMQ